MTRVAMTENVTMNLSAGGPTRTRNVSTYSSAIFLLTFWRLCIPTNQPDDEINELAASSI